MKIVEKNAFKKARKKLHDNQERDLQNAVLDIVRDIKKGGLKIGKEKSGDLRGIRVHKFKMVGQLTLLAYEYEDEIITLTLLAFGSHENFYRDLKR